MRVVALAGGVGGAKLVRGLALALGIADASDVIAGPNQLTAVVNTGDDTIFHGLHVSPDLDTVVYTLAGLVEEKQGWGVADDSFACLDHLARLGEPSWFALGDKDLAMHIVRTKMLGDGHTLSQICNFVCRQLGIGTRVLPMTDDEVRTKISVRGLAAEIDFQEYFVQRGHKDEVSAVRFDSAHGARPAPGVLEAIDEAGTIVICPSNPTLSVAPILAIPGISEALVNRRDHVLAVSPIVERKALRGPAAMLLEAQGLEASATSVASIYAPLISTFVLDVRDHQEAPQIADLRVRAAAVDTIMNSAKDAERLAQDILSL